jgi:hypothetical protein
MRDCKWLVCKARSNHHCLLEMWDDIAHPIDLYAHYKICLDKSLNGTIWCFHNWLSIEAIYILI